MDAKECAALSASIQKKRDTDPVISKLEFMRDNKDMLRMLNGAYIAERFFHKSGSWFSQKLNNNLKNGKPCEFTAAELETLRNALYTMALEIQDLADNMQ